ncbi:MAG: hypothetical protein IPI46_08700 [Bacteroidetes bacterium]|nr:hypothetical protein [Bacteroidota bacterium]
MKNIIFLFFCLTLVGCRAKIAMLLYGIDSTPKPKSSGYIQSYIKKKELPTSNQYLIDAIAFSEIGKMDRMISRYLLFDKNGNLLIDTFQNTCTGNPDLGIENVIRNKYYIVDSTYNLGMITNHIIDTAGEKRVVNISKKADYVVILTWATWAGKLNQQGYMRWHEQATSIKDKYNLEILNINVDLLKTQDYSKIKPDKL